MPIFYEFLFNRVNLESNQYLVYIPIVISANDLILVSLN